MYINQDIKHWTRYFSYYSDWLASKISPKMFDIFFNYFFTSKSYYFYSRGVSNTTPLTVASQYRHPQTVKIIKNVTESQSSTLHILPNCLSWWCRPQRLFPVFFIFTEIYVLYYYDTLWLSEFLFPDLTRKIIGQKSKINVKEIKEKIQQSH